MFNYSLNLKINVNEIRDILEEQSKHSWPLWRDLGCRENKEDKEFEEVKPLLKVSLQIAFIYCLQHRENPGQGKLDVGDG